MSEASLQTVLSAAESLGIHFQKPQYAEELAQDAEFRVTKILKSISLLKRTTHSEKVTCEHISSVLKYLRDPPLLGYFPDSDYEVREKTADGVSFRYTVDKQASLKDITTEEIPAGSRSVPFDFEWKTVDGILLEKDQKSGKTKVPLKSFNSEERFKASPLEDNLKTFYQEATQLILSDTPQYMQSLVENIQNSVGISPLVPNLLQFFIVQIAQELDNYARMISVANAVLALVLNKSIPVSMYAHSFMKIGFTFLHKKSCCGTVDQDCRLRMVGGEIIISLVKECGSGFPGIRSETIKQLTNAMYDSINNFAIVFGSVCTLVSMDEECFTAIVPHIRYVYKLANKHLGNAYAVNTALFIEHYVNCYIRMHPKADHALIGSISAIIC